MMKDALGVAGSCTLKMAAKGGRADDEPKEECTQKHITFERTISWQLSQVQDHFEYVMSSRKKIKKKRIFKEDACPSSCSDSPSYIIVTNSDGEDEVYYSAAESPVTSDDDEIAVVLPLSLVDPVSKSVPLPSPSKADKKISRKKKKKKRKLERMMRSDFFKPLCDLLDDDNVSVDVDSFNLSNYSNVLSLSELCLRSIKKMPLEQMELQLPFLITSLVGHDRQLSGAVSFQVQWLEKLFGDVEKAVIKLEKETVTNYTYQRGRNWKAEKLKFLFKLMLPWNYNFRPISTDDFHTFEGYHCHVPCPFYSFNSDIVEYTNEGRLLGHLLHYCNYFYPVAINEKASNTAIGRVNYWIQSRYSKIALIYSNFFKLWPAYIHWARGNLRLAASLFSSELDAFEVIDKVVILNEMGRMFLHFGERSLAYFTFVKSSEVEVPVQHFLPGYTFQPLLTNACYKALQAAVWDTGLLDILTASKAKTCWDLVFKLISDSPEFPRDIWFLNVAGVESRLRVHAGKCISSSVSEKENNSTEVHNVEGWLNDCVELLQSHNMLLEFPILNYHLSLIYALKKMKEPSRKAYNCFIDNFAGFHDWGNAGLPGQLFQPPFLPRHQYCHPWENLFTLLEPLKRVPILKIHWRVQLLHPIQPYSKKDGFSHIAEHCPSSGSLNLRLTSEGDLTGDILMNLPPIRSVCINPYNGNLQFRRLSSFQNYTLSSRTTNQQFSIPMPHRIYESSSCVVELSLGYHEGMDNSKCSNYAAILHWYGSDGSLHKLDLRKLIRKKAKQALLQEIERREDKLNILPEEALSLVDKMMEFGLPLSTNELVYFKSQQSNDKQKKEFKRFKLNLLSNVTFGKNTVMLNFSLASNQITNIIVFLNCSSVGTFMTPKIHCSLTPNGFSDVYPHYDMSLLYENRHLSHLKYSLAMIMDLKPNTYLIFNEEGEIVNEIMNNNNTEYTIIGHRLFNVSLAQDLNCIVSSSVLDNKKSHSSYPIFSLEDIIMGAPGLLFVRSQSGLLLLHPGTLERVNVIGLRNTDGIDPVQDGFIYPQLTSVNGRSSILGLYDVSICKEELSSLQCQTDSELLPDDIADYGSCRVALAVNDRFIVIHCSEKTLQVKIELDVSLPGYPNDFHVIPGLGFAVSASQFSDKFRSELCLLSLTGSFLGILPCLGQGPYSFFSKFLPPLQSHEQNDKYSGGFHIFFNDGLGGICCVRLNDVLW